MEESSRNDEQEALLGSYDNGPLHISDLETGYAAFSSQFPKHNRSWMGGVKKVMSTQWLRRRHVDYDEDKDMGGNTGIRVWYEDYTAIDWIHDHVKEQKRRARLREMRGAKGYLTRLTDGLKGWILVFLTGVTAACLAGGIDLASSWLSDIRSGYCTTSILKTKNTCCKDLALHEPCKNWALYSSILITDKYLLKSSFDNAMFIVNSVILAVLSSLLVTATPSDATPSGRRNQHQKRIKYFATGSGIPEIKVIMGGFVIRGFLGFRTLVVKTVGVILSYSSGLMVGIQGPLVHITSCVANVYSRLFHKYSRNEAKLREILSAACAAGVSVAFGAPIGGVLYSLEETSFYFPSKTMWRTFFCSFVSAFTLKFINPFGTGKLVRFQVTYDSNWHAFELIPFLFLGVLGGLYGALFIKLISLWGGVRKSTLLHKYPVLEVTLIAALSAFICYPNVFTRMKQAELLSALFSECSAKQAANDLCMNDNYTQVLALLGLALLVKVILMNLTFGITVPAGIFMPSMVVGALGGRILGLLISQFYKTYPDFYMFASCEYKENCIIPGVYALVGAAAVLTGITKATVSLAVIMFELTGALSYLLPIIVAIMVSRFVGDAFGRLSAMESLIEQNSLPYLNNRFDYVTTGSLKDFTDVNVITINIWESNTIGSLKEKANKLVGTPLFDSGFPVLDGEYLIGYISAQELVHALELLSKAEYNEDTICKLVDEDNQLSPDSSNVGKALYDLSPFVDTSPPITSGLATSAHVLELFRKLGLRYIIVVDKGKFSGVIHKKGLLAFLKDKM